MRNPFKRPYKPPKYCKVCGCKVIPTRIHLWNTEYNSETGQGIREVSYGYGCSSTNDYGYWGEYPWHYYHVTEMRTEIIEAVPECPPQ